MDANVVVSSADLDKWDSEATPELRDKTSGVVLLAKGDKVQQLVEQCVPIRPPVAILGTDPTPRLKQKNLQKPILSVSVPFKFENGSPVGIPPSPNVPISLSIVYSKQTPEVVEALTWALRSGYTVDVDVQFTTDDKSYDSLEESLSTASKDADPESAIVLCQCLLRSLPSFFLSSSRHSECTAASGRSVSSSRETSHPSNVQGLPSPRRIVIADSQHLYKVPPAKLA